MHEGPHIPGAVRVLARLLIMIFETAGDIARRLEPLVRPPEDLEITSRIGTLYSGVVVIDRSEVLAGCVVAVGQGIPFAGGGSGRSSLISSGPSRSERLPSWAEDRRISNDEVPPWMR